MCLWVGDWMSLAQEGKSRCPMKDVGLVEQISRFSSMTNTLTCGARATRL